MPIRHAIWTVSGSPANLAESVLPSEQVLEDMIVADPRILSTEWMLVGRQEDTGHGGRIDLLAIAPDGALVLIELKRDRTPRDVVAQAIDYAAWVEGLKSEDVAAIYGRFKPGGNLADDFRVRFGQTLQEEMLNTSHQIVVVAASLDTSTERIVSYLSARDIPINVLCFQVFNHGSAQFLSRAWLFDPVQTQASAAQGGTNDKEPWNGEFYANFDHGAARSWAEAVQYGFISAGGGRWYSNTLRLLDVGARVWVLAPGHGFVGVGTVSGPPQSLTDFSIATQEGERPAAEVLTEGRYSRDTTDPERAEWFVPVRWIKTVPLNSAFNEVGLFGNQNTVCKPKTPKWRHTVDRLKSVFAITMIFLRKSGRGLRGPSFGLGR